MKITINQIGFSNFKGDRPTEMTFGTGINTITGANGSGKTTVLDAIIWCLFGKDFTDRKKFDIVPLNPDGSSMKVNPSVVLDISVDNDPVKLSRRLEGSKTICEINDAPCQTLKVFDDYIAGLFGTEERFKMFTMPLFFTESLHWTKQRELLMQYFPEPEAASVFERMKKEKIKFSKELISGMERMQPADYIAKHDKAMKDIDVKRSKISAQMALLDDQLEGNQVVDESALEAERDKLTMKRNKLNETIATITAQNRVILTSQNKLNDAKMTAQSEIDMIKKRALMNHEQGIEILKNKIQQFSNQKHELIKKYHEQSKPVEENCPTCHQHLPAAMISNVKAKQAESLKEISENGTSLKNEIERLTSELEEIQSSNEYLSDCESKRIQELTKLITDSETKLKELPAKREVPEVDQAVEDRLAEINKALARIDVHRENIERKNKLEADGRQLSQKYEQAEIAVAEASKFAFYRSTLVVEAVNKHFKSISVKVLDVQKNGVAKETFEITSKGVPYSGLNKTGKIAASLELLEFLKSSLKIESPVIIDDVENYPDLDLSTISGQLIVAFAKKSYPLEVINKYPQDI